MSRILSVSLPLFFCATAAAQSDWNLLSPGSSPSMRTAHAMSYDLFRDRVVVFGGTPGGLSNALNDTWEFDGTTWTNVSPSPANSPSARVGHIMAFDLD